MRTNESPKHHNNKWYILDAPAIWWFLGIIAIYSWLTIGVMNQKKWPAGEKLTTPTIEWTEEIQRVTDTVRDAVSTTQDLQDKTEDARVKALFDEAIAKSKAKQKTNEKLLAEIQKKAEDPEYVPNREDRFVLQKFWIAFGDGYIPYKWDGKENNEEKK